MTKNGDRNPKVYFCVSNEDFQKEVNKTLRFKEVTPADGMWSATDEFIAPNKGVFRYNTSFNYNTLEFVKFAFSGLYLFTLFLNTNTCGSFSICSATKIALAVNNTIIKIFQTGSSNDARHDLEFLSATLLLLLKDSDIISLRMLSTASKGISNLEFCGVRL